MTSSDWTGFLRNSEASAPSLQVYLNADNLTGLRDDTQWAGGSGSEMFAALRQDGFDGVQLTTNDSAPADAALPHCGLDRINTPAEADVIVASHAERGDTCVTVHAGWGLEDDDEVDRLVNAILIASSRHGVPVFLETHRATITQDMWRTVRLTERFPEVRFNGDFSHYYCGQEMVYGDFETKLQFLQPVFDRVGFLHGRIASPGCMQVPINADLRARPSAAHGEVDYLPHFREMWTRAMMGFLRHAGPGAVLIFAPELLAGTHYYARLFPDGSGRMREETDRYAQALLYKQLAKECFAQAQHRLHAQTELDEHSDKEGSIPHVSSYTP